MSDSDDDFFDELLKSKSKKKSNKLIDNLYEIPKRDKGVNMPHFQYYDPNVFQQADLLFLPEDIGCKYALVIADIGSRLCDAEPVKNKSNNAINVACNTIYERKIIEIPKVLTVDLGTEFKGSCIKMLEGMGIQVKTNIKDRHRQNAIVERKNQTIGTMIHKRQTAQEILTGETSRAWVNDLPKIIKAVNKKVKTQVRPKESDDPVCSGDACELLEAGQKVRVALEAPQDTATGKKLHGKFRSGDVRWDRTIRTIKAIILKPNFPPMYLLEPFASKYFEEKVFHPVAYTKAQLQPVKADEEQPTHKDIRPEQGDKYVIDKIIDKKIERNNKEYYLIQWKGYDKPTWEPAQTIKEDVPKLVKEYEAKSKAIDF